MFLQTFQTPKLWAFLCVCPAEQNTAIEKSMQRDVVQAGLRELYPENTSLQSLSATVEAVAETPHGAIWSIRGRPRS